ncbi:MAG: hypothetical protein JOZ15_15270, partial [Acidobacteria bacterium]|nr:hypothetical protein [Acidobacteriota bacterium]
MKLAAEPGAVLALGIFILGGCGMLGRPLLPWRARPFLCLVAPLFGLVLVGWLARVLGAAGLALASAAWCFVALAALGWTMALVRGRLRRPNRQIALVLAVCCVALALAAWPVASFGRLTSVGATADAVAAARLSEQLQGQPLPLGDRTPTLAHTAELYVLGLLALLSRHRAFEV